MGRPPLRVGLIGLGGVGRLHLEACRVSDAVDLVAVCDSDPARLDAVAGSGIALHRDHREMLARQPLDLVCVLTPAATHAGIVADIAAAGVDVMTEKPMAASLAEARAMADACAAAGVRLFYGSSYRHIPAIGLARRLIREGAIGDPLLLRETHVGGAGPSSREPLPSSHYPPGGIGGTGMGLVDHGVHLIDIFSWLVGEPVAWATGRGNRSGDRLATEYAVLGFPGGATGHLLYEDGSWPTDLPAEGMFGWGGSWDHRGYRPGGGWDAHPGCIHVHGTRGALRIFHYGHALFLIDAEGTRQIPLPDAPAPAHFRLQIEAFADDIAHGRAPSTDGEAGLAALRVVEAIYESGDLGRVVRL